VKQCLKTTKFQALKTQVYQYSPALFLGDPLLEVADHLLDVDVVAAGRLVGQVALQQRRAQAHQRVQPQRLRLRHQPAGAAHFTRNSSKKCSEQNIVGIISNTYNNRG